MDHKTREQRRRNKEMARNHFRNSGLSEFETRGLGRKAKSPNTFPLRQCDHISNGKKITFRKKRKDNTSYLVTIIKGGNRCPRTAITGKKCSEHGRLSSGGDVSE
jgi:hypothetical protein